MDDASPGLFCPHCGYDLRTLITDQCPECGGAVDEQSMRATMVPWEARAHLGRWRALWRTAWRVTFKTKAFCQAVGRPVSYTDARRFQWTVVGLVFVSFLCTVAWWVLNVWGLEKPAELASWIGFSGWVAILIVVLYLGGFGLMMLLGTGIHSYWFHPPKLSIEQQNRAIALSYYACAPLLVLIPVQVGFVGVTVAVQYVPDHNAPMAAELAVVGTVLLLLAVGALAITSVWRLSVVMARRVAGRSWLGQLTLAMTQATFLVLAILGLPAMLFYSGVMFMSW